MTHPSSTPAPSSRCGKPTTVLAAWPAESTKRESVPEVPLEDLLESSLMNSLEDLFGQHRNDVLESAALAREQEALRRKQEQQRVRAAKRQNHLRAVEEHEARRNDIQVMREGLARRDARKAGAALAAQTLAVRNAELRSAEAELCFAREIAEAAQRREKRRLHRWLQAAMMAAGLSAVVGVSGLQYHEARNTQELSALAVQAEAVRAEASQKVSTLEAQLAGHDAISAEQTRDLELELEQARIALSEAEEALTAEAALARGSTTPPPPRPRRLANKSSTKTTSSSQGSSDEKTGSGASIASNAPDLDSLSACDPHDPMCFEL